MKKLDIDRYERGIIINALNQFRNNLLDEGLSTDAVDELLLKIIESPKMKGFVLESKKDDYSR